MCSVEIFAAAVRSRLLSNAAAAMHHLRPQPIDMRAAATSNRIAV
jgi:hypothetical protein